MVETIIQIYLMTSQYLQKWYYPVIKMFVYLVGNRTSKDNNFMSNSNWRVGLNEKKMVFFYFFLFMIYVALNVEIFGGNETKTKKMIKRQSPIVLSLYLSLYVWKLKVGWGHECLWETKPLIHMCLSPPLSCPFEASLLLFFLSLTL